MNNFKEFLMQYRGAIIGVMVAILILLTGFYKLIIAIILVFMGAFVGNYIQQNKYDVKEKIKNFVDKL